MLSPALLVVFVMSPARIEPTTIPLERAAREVLGPSAELQVEAVRDLLSDTAALERAGAADGVVELHWNGTRQTVELHCYVASEQRWVDRTIQFAPADRDPDRGRMLGFVLASMFVDAPSFARARALGQAPLERAPLEMPSPAPVPSQARLAEPAGKAAAESTVTPADSTHAPAARWQQEGGPHSLEFAGVATSALGASDGAELGALAALGIPLLEPVSLRIQLAARQGEIPVAQANVRRVIAGVGLAWNALPESSHVELRLRADALGSWIGISHLSSDDVAAVGSHGWLFGGEAVATLGYRISTLLTFSLGVGVEAMLGQTHVFTHGVERATLPGIRGLGELGFVTHF
jgi:hypothetical protein